MSLHLKNNSEGEDRIVPLRLQRFLARAGIASRRGSENLMSAGRVTVNGVVITELGSRVDPLVDEVAVDGTVVSYPERAVTLMLNKPAGCITTMSDPHGRANVSTLVPVETHPGLFPVGRLDADTTGLLLFTTDGELGHRLTHPRHHVDKTYRAEVEGVLSREQLDLLRRGIELDDGITLPASVDIVEASKNGSVVRITIREGRKRQVRRMFETTGHPVVALKRESIGPISLGGLREGTWRYLSETEVRLLRKDGSD